MSFLSEHIAKETGQDEPVAGPKSPHYVFPHHEKPEPAKLTGRVVMHVDGKSEVNEHPPEPPKRRRYFMGKDSV